MLGIMNQLTAVHVIAESSTFSGAGTTLPNMTAIVTLRDPSGAVVATQAVDTPVTIDEGGVGSDLGYDLTLASGDGHDELDDRPAVHEHRDRRAVLGAGRHRFELRGCRLDATR